MFSVEWLNPTVDGDQAFGGGGTGGQMTRRLRNTPYLRDGSLAGRTRGPFLHLMISFGPSLIFMQWLRTEAIISAIISAIILAIISAIIWGLSVASRHGDEMTGPATPKQWGPGHGARR